MVFRELSFSRLECGVHDRLHIYPLCGIFYFPWHRHQIEGTNGFYRLIRKTERFTISNVESQVFTPRIILAAPGTRTRAAGVLSVRPTTGLTAPLSGRLYIYCHLWHCPRHLAMVCCLSRMKARSMNAAEPNTEHACQQFVFLQKFTSHLSDKTGCLSSPHYAKLDETGTPRTAPS